jgi:uncharacterized protein YbaP (TraB family)
VALLLLVFLGSCSSDKSSVDDGKYPLWKVKGDHNVVWLLGSVHMLPEEAHPLPKAFDDAYNQADKVVFEVVIDQDNPMASLMGMVSSMMLPSGKTLEDVLSPELWKVLEPRLDDMVDRVTEMVADQYGDNIPMEIEPEMVKSQLVRMKPWVIAFMLQQTEVSMDKYKAELGVDFHYMMKAEKDGKETIGLETLEEQMGFLESVSDENVEAMLRKTLMAQSPESASIDDIVAAWQSGNIDVLDSLVNGSLQDSPEAYETLIVNRNRHWVPEIEKYLHDSVDYLVVVGAGHLVGRQSVVALLREKGYSVERL